MFHEKLGTVKDKAERVMALAKELAPKVGANPDEAYRAAMLAKCDLVSDMVGEFAELEGVMGRYYATLQKEPQAIADAVRDHYKPKGPSDQVPSDPVAVAVALADKLDTLVGFWAIDEKPTGSKDPYALRRAALGLISLDFEELGPPEAVSGRSVCALHPCLSQKPNQKAFAALIESEGGVAMVRDRLAESRANAQDHDEVPIEFIADGGQTEELVLEPPRLLRRPPEGAPAGAGCPP